MGWIDRIFDRVWHVTRGDEGANEHVSVRSGIVFFDDQDDGSVFMGLINNGSPSPFRMARLTWDKQAEALRGPITSRARGNGTSYQLTVTRMQNCNQQMIRQGLCSTPGKPVLRFEIEAFPSAGAHGGGSGGTWHAED